MIKLIKKYSMSRALRILSVITNRFVLRQETADWLEHFKLGQFYFKNTTILITGNNQQFNYLKVFQQNLLYSIQSRSSPSLTIQ